MSGTPHAAILICIVSSGLIRLSISNTPERSPKSCCDSVRFLHKVLHIFCLRRKLLSVNNGIGNPRPTQNAVPRGVSVRFRPPAPSNFAGSDKPIARGLEPASVEHFGLDGPRSAERNDNRRMLSCWHLADHPGGSHRHKSTARSVNSPCNQSTKLGSCRYHQHADVGDRNGSQFRPDHCRKHCGRACAWTVRFIAMIHSGRLSARFG